MSDLDNYPSTAVSMLQTANEIIEQKSKRIAELEAALPWVMCPQCGKSHRNVSYNLHSCRCDFTRWTYHTEKPDAPSWEPE